MGASHVLASPATRRAGETRGMCRSMHRRHASSESCVPSSSHASAMTPHRQTRNAPRSAAARSASRRVSATTPLLSRSANARSSKTETSVSRSTAEGSRATCAFQNCRTAAGTGALAFPRAGGESAFWRGAPSPPSTSMGWGASGYEETPRRSFSSRARRAFCTASMVNSKRIFSVFACSARTFAFAPSSAREFLRFTSRYLMYASMKPAASEVPARFLSVLA
mmetsp:Transcript_13054/g.55651  ORF Transcript_13054/g.55651 Transcript_13054/m.55651 type:complete len:223 (-) Transcript_13054:840-1508(-)